MSENRVSAISVRFEVYGVSRDKDKWLRQCSYVMSWHYEDDTAVVIVSYENAIRELREPFHENLIEVIAGHLERNLLSPESGAL